MFGIPTIQTDYTIDPKVFDIDSFGYRPALGDDKNRYYLRKAIVKAYRNAGVSNSIADQIATRNLDSLLEQAKMPGLVQASATL